MAEIAAPEDLSLAKDEAVPNVQRVSPGQ